MKIGMVIATNDTETVWNALRFANFSLNLGDQVSIFFMGKGVEYQQIGTDKYNVIDQAETILNAGGSIFACGTCIQSREQNETAICPISTMKDMYEIIKESDKILTF